MLPARATTPEGTPSPRAVTGLVTRRHTPDVIVRLSLAYDGTSFRGWARNAGQRTVEGVLSDALTRVLGDAPKLSVAGRTDAGVHARGQVASFVADR